ncbi:MAG: TIGR04282 family arsenosugar biosynthesis glycosyltransferase [Burkholderiaceae bacterium]
MTPSSVDGDGPLPGLRSVQVAVMAKAPVPGFAKTRLIPALGAHGAARLQRRLTCRAIRVALDAGLGAVTLWCAPDARHRYFRVLERAAGVACRPQPDGDLGERMHAAFRWHCPAGPLLLIGTDCPPLRPSHLREAARALLHGDDAVFVPVDDGGYVLVGLREPRAELFDDVHWSTASVMSETRERARAAGLTVNELATLWDLDVPRDLDRLSLPDAEALGVARG